MRVVVTGCAGFIGSQLSERLVVDGHEVVGVDCLTDYYAVSLKQANLAQLRGRKSFTYVPADLAEVRLEPIIDGADVVFHQAAQPGVRGSWGNTFDVYLRNNVLATQRLLEAVKDRPVRKFVYASSSSVYGDAEAFPTGEDALPQPYSPYGATKLAGEHLVTLYCRNFGVPTIALRYFTVYGPRQRPDMAFHRFIRSALEDRPINIFGDGEQTRDFTFISDALDANLAAATCEAAGMVMNIGGGSRVSVNDVIKRLRDLVGKDVRVSYTQAAQGDVRHTSADTRRAASVLNYAPKVDLRAGLTAEIEWVEHMLSTGLVPVSGAA
jgi:nucleoside-diphosphate-sugar epimerase